MKAFSLVVAAFVFLNITGSLVAEEPPISVTIAVPRDRDRRAIRYHESPDGHFHVILTNNSNEPQRIWKEWCSWGYYGLSFEISDGSGKTWIVKKKPRGWTRNFPDWWTLDPHDNLVIDIHFNDAGVWDGFPWPVDASQPYRQDASQTFKMRAVVDFARPDEFSKKYSIWTGRAVSKVDEYEFFQGFW